MLEITEKPLGFLGYIQKDIKWLALLDKPEGNKQEDNYSNANLNTDVNGTRTEVDRSLPRGEQHYLFYRINEVTSTNVSSFIAFRKLISLNC